MTFGRDGEAEASMPPERGTKGFVDKRSRFDGEEVGERSRFEGEGRDRFDVVVLGGVFADGTLPAFALFVFLRKGLAMG